ncbi:cytokine-like nuclear factor N-PAC [Anthonomus grandis grandis]|uniref:cytokine-like nuclear factor N-PAC n=1 Tax=Anthonomus grandis grandis TaxID=2921223 RepID=UPI0021665997|nr:cytokine-like nuclear factor N-PAC [Anthonomus grandis grandis]
MFCQTETERKLEREKQISLRDSLFEERFAKMKASFKVGSLVWTRMKNCPVWPARIEPQPDPPKKGQSYVYFFGAKIEEQYGWVANSAITKYDHETRSQLEDASNRADFKQGVEQIEAEYKKSLGKDSEGEPEYEFEKAESDEAKSEGNRRSRQVKRKNEGLASTSRATKAPKKVNSEPSENGAKSYKMSFVADKLRDGQGRLTPASDVDVDEESEDLDEETTDKNLTVGFLGVGVMSQGIISNVINAGHTVYLWSRDDTKAKSMEEKARHEGQVTVCMTPCDVMTACDIVFNCTSDPESARKMVLDNCGVLHGCDSLDGKGFVELTGIDPQTSVKLADSIAGKGGRYLEAQMHGSREEAIKGTLIMLTAGDSKLFMKCQPFFQAMAKSSLYLGDVGVASRIYLILQLMQGINLVGLAEGLVLADRCGISGKDMMDIFNMTSMASPYLSSKAKKIIDKDFKTVDQSIKNIQKDIRLALGLSDDLMQPLMMASTANEVFKHSRKLGFDDQDCSCVYMKARY